MGQAITFGSWCSGIEAASAAFLPLGWECAYVAEIEPFACALLAQRYGAGRPVYMPRPEDAPDEKTARERRAAIKALDRIEWGTRLTNWGDISQIKASDLPPVDILVAGLPCQGFSIAGLRRSLADDRGNLTLIAVRKIHDLARAGLVRGFLFENVPAILNTPDNAFGCFLGAVVGADDPLQGLEHGGKWPRAGMVAGPRARVAWRVLDAQYFGLAQRRERVFAVADFGDGADPAAVLFERASLSRNPPARGQAGEGVAGNIAPGAGSGGRCVARELIAFNARQDLEVTSPVSGSLDCSSPQAQAQAVAFSLRGRGGEVSAEVEQGPVSPALRAVDGGSSHAFVATSEQTAWSIMPQNSGKDFKAREVDVAQPLMAAGPVGGNQGGNQGGDYIQAGMAVRRITCVEAEILQGFPPNYTLIDWPSANRKGDDLAETIAYLRSHGLSDNEAVALAQTPDGPRYKGIGNSWAVPVARWIGERIGAAMPASAQREGRSHAA